MISVRLCVFRQLQLGESSTRSQSQITNAVVSVERKVDTKKSKRKLYQDITIHRGKVFLKAIMHLSLKWLFIQHETRNL